MTAAAVEHLSKDPDGFFLMVESGRIDHAHHDNFAKRALEETVEMEKAVKVREEKGDKLLKKNISTKNRMVSAIIWLMRLSEKPQ